MNELEVIYLDTDEGDKAYFESVYLPAIKEMARRWARQSKNKMKSIWK